MHEFVSNFLTFLERREEKLLSWGFYTVQYTEDEMLYALENESSRELREQWDSLKVQGVTFHALIREMRQTHLLYRNPDSPKMHRTRMAEGVRLLANLRQMFNQHNWATAPRLVSDIKLHLRDRVYPRRDLMATSVWNDKLKDLCPQGKQKLLKDCYDALSRNDQGNAFNFSGFQKRSFEHIFKEYNSGNRSASVVCAGTGSGKTKAFYVPTFLRIAEEISNDSTAYTKVIAIYPRNVLLADQLREALSEAKKLSPVLEQYGNRQMTFGALLGSTPIEYWFRPVPTGQTRPHYHWEQKENGHVIPYLRSPEDGQSDLIWRETDRINGRTSLYRIGETDPDIPDGVLRITREQLMNNPPDILFLSLEMLNREMGNPQWKKTFGIGQGNRAPRLVLLDEVHTYEGIAGAQAAWVLRRWKYWAQPGTPHFVGLSATLKEAHEHMGRMCGVYPDQVTEFTPRVGTDADGEMEAEGQEYNLAIKGDPSSGTALLSTSIQTGMLMTRLLTPQSHFAPPTSQIQEDTLYAKKAFGFTDNLDSLNRWYSNMRDAERKRLARLREMPVPHPNQQILRRMREEGQIWELPLGIGHDLSQPLEVSRCSSQDPGANANSDIILATSSLEVGFDDPQVGMILHHKAPISMASFVQRKGRAGRTRGSRPWTVVILSDYGRDRWAFKSAERLFNPEIDHIHLPIANPYVLRVQMALFMVDWLGHKINQRSSPFSYLGRPGTWDLGIRAQQSAKIYLKDFLQQGARWEKFFEDAFRLYFYNRGGLSWKSDQDKAVATKELNDIFWEQPRPLLTEGIPTLLRKLEVGWKHSLPGRPEEDIGVNRPMPQAIPKATFNELDLNESRIELEPYRGRHKEDEMLPVAQFLRENCPGKVSKRFSTLANMNPPEPGYWHEHSPQLEVGQNYASVSQLYSEVISLSMVDRTQIFRPTNVKLSHIPEDVIESSSSEWEWHTIANVQDNGREDLPLKGSKPWKQVFSRVTANLHINGSWIELTRYASSCRFEIRRRRGLPTVGTLDLQSAEGSPEAVGFQINADGLRFELDRDHLEQCPEITPQMLGQFRYEYFLHKIKTSPQLRDHLNVFRAEWMAQISIAMLCAISVKHKIPLDQAQERVRSNRLGAANRVLDTIFQLRGVDLQGNEEESRLRGDLIGLWGNTSIVSEIECLESSLWEDPPGSDFDEWIRQRYLATLAQALSKSAANMSDQISEEDLKVDVISSDDKDEIFLTEKSSGGLGQIESIVSEIKKDPRFFLEAIEDALISCPRESWANNLFAVTKCAHLEHKAGSGELVDAFSEVRNALNYNALNQAKESLMKALYDLGISQQRDNISAVSMKLLRPGSSRHTDTLTFLVNEAWKRQSRKLGLEIPIRTFAYIITSFNPSYRRLMELFIQEYNEPPNALQIYSVIQQLLFEGCADSCPDCLNRPNYLNDFGKPARNLALSWLSLEIPEVVIDRDVNEWTAKARESLAKEGRVCLIAQVDLQDLLVENLTPLFFEELNVKTYREPVHINRIERVGGSIKVILCIRNFTNA